MQQRCIRIMKLDTMNFLKALPWVEVASANTKRIPAIMVLLVQFTNLFQIFWSEAEVEYVHVLCNVYRICWLGNYSCKMEQKSPRNNLLVTFFICDNGCNSSIKKKEEKKRNCELRCDKKKRISHLK